MLRAIRPAIFVVLGAVVFALGCSGAGSGTPATPGPGSDPTRPDPRPDPRPGSGTAMPDRPDPVSHPLEPTRAAHDPEVFPPEWTKVGVGQTISFSVAAIDQDLDETAVEVTAMPAGAAFDPLTQTVTWTPTKAQIGSQKFELA